MGTQWGGFFNITAPDPVNGIGGTPISEVQMLVGELAGNNSLHHDFLTDPRVFAWCIGNEIDIGQPSVYSWSIATLNILNANGAVTMIGSPINSTLSPSGDWMAESNLNSIYPALSGHVSIINFHYYNALYAAMNAQNAGQSVYTAAYNAMVSDLQTYLLSGIGNTSLTQVMIGEEGIPNGYCVMMGDTFNFTSQSTQQYCQAMYDSAKAVGIKNVFFFDGFQDYYMSEGQYWYCISSSGTYVTAETSIIQAES